MLTLNQRVVGSNPTAPTNLKKKWYPEGVHEGRLRPELLLWKEDQQKYKFDDVYRKHSITTHDCGIHLAGFPNHTYCKTRWKGYLVEDERNTGVGAA